MNTPVQPLDIPSNSPTNTQIHALIPAELFDRQIGNPQSAISNLIGGFQRTYHHAYGCLLPHRVKASQTKAGE
jgi:hypothetical protein